MKKCIAVIMAVIMICQGYGVMAADIGYKEIAEDYFKPDWVKQWDEISPMNESDNFIVKKDGKCGVADQFGNVIIETAYDDVFGMNNGFIIIKINEKWGVLDRKGHEVLPAQYSYPLIFNENIMSVEMEGDNTTVFYNGSGEVLAKGEFYYESTSSTDEIAVFGCFIGEEYKYGAVDTVTGKTICPYEYNSVLAAVDGRVLAGKEIAKNSYEYVYIDSKGNTEKALTTDNLKLICNNGYGDYFTAKDFMVKYVDYNYSTDLYDTVISRIGVMDGDFNVVTENVYEQDGLYSGEPFFRDGYAVMYKDSINYSYVKGIGHCGSGGKSGLINKKGQITVPFEYNSISYAGYGKFYAVQGDNQWLIDGNGNRIVKLYGDRYYSSYYGNIFNYFKDEYMGASDINGMDLLSTGDIKYAWSEDGLRYMINDETEEDKKYIALNAVTECSAWAEKEIKKGTDNNLVPVKLRNQYKYNINRQEFCQLVMRLYEVKTGKATDEILSGSALDTVFWDTENRDVFAAYTLGIVKGVGNDAFNPYSDITRQEAAIMLKNTAEVIGLEGYSKREEEYFDDSQIAQWAKDYVYEVSGIKNTETGTAVLNGVGENRFDPLGGYTREESIATIVRLYEM